MDSNGKNPDWSATPAGQHLQARLSDERTLEALDHILQRIDTLETAVARLADIMEQGPGFVAMAADMVDDQVREAKAKGIYVDERFTQCHRSDGKGHCAGNNGAAH